MKRKVLKITVLCLLFVGCTQAQSPHTAIPPLEASILNAPPQVSETEKQEYELVFCLDATGSMSGLIATAKEKIWDIVSGISQAQDVSKVKLGLVFYRDKGDAFVTKTYPLTDNIDSLYSQLLAIQAQGGGDEPESVNESLDEAVNKMPWSQNTQTFRTIFLVGDCPPHMDYNEVKYPESCTEANKKNVVINTIKLGNSCGSAIPHFKKIAMLTNGTYQQLGQNAADVVYNTPYDDSIIYYSRYIDESKIYYGSTAQKEVMKSKKEMSLNLYDKSSSSATSSRASYNWTSAGKSNWFGSNELLQDIIDGKVSLDTLSKEQLPDELKEKTKEEQKSIVLLKQQERVYNMNRLDVLVKQKDVYIRTEKTNNSGEESFSDKVIETMKVQAKRK